MNAPVRNFEAIPGYKNYSISRDGDIFSVFKGGLLRPCPAKRGGYLQVALRSNGQQKTWFVHQLVAFVFHGQRPSKIHHAAHRDGNKLNNTVDNVQWITKVENEADKIGHGTSNQGERCGTAKLTEAQVIEIRTRAAALPRSSGGKRIKKGALEYLAEEYGVTKGCLHQAINKRHWAHI